MDAVNSPPTFSSSSSTWTLPTPAVAAAQGSFATSNKLNGTAVINGLASATNYTVRRCSFLCFVAIEAWACTQVYLRAHNAQETLINLTLVFGCALLGYNMC